VPLPGGNSRHRSPTERKEAAGIMPQKTKRHHRVSWEPVTAAGEIVRSRLGLSPAEFARQFMLNLRTLQDWEQGRRTPEDIARIYLRVIEHDPDAVRAALED
jgi:DNA-binding transcriptional regulator YiaG